MCSVSWERERGQHFCVQKKICRGPLCHPQFVHKVLRTRPRCPFRAPCRAAPCAPTLSTLHTAALSTAPALHSCVWLSLLFEPLRVGTREFSATNLARTIRYHLKLRNTYTSSSTVCSTHSPRPQTLGALRPAGARSRRSCPHRKGRAGCLAGCTPRSLRCPPRTRARAGSGRPPRRARSL